MLLISALNCDSEVKCEVRVFGASNTFLRWSQCVVVCKWPADQSVYGQDGLPDEWDIMLKNMKWPW